MEANTIVVGVDGSGEAAAALDFAVAEATLREAPLRVVCAWEVPITAFGDGMIPAVSPEAFDTYRAQAERLVEDAVGRIRSMHPAMTCEGVAVEGLPTAVLIDESENAGLLVVGSRGRGGFKSLLLGSVSQQVVQHAACPVVVVRPRRET